MQIQTRNLLHWAKKEWVNTQTMNKYLVSNPTTERRIGALPFEWIKDIPKTERSSITEKIHKVFEEFSINTAKIRGENYHFGYSGRAEDFLPQQNKLVELLKNILRRNDIKIEYVGNGFLKNCSKIIIGNKSYALSTFRINCTHMNGYFSKGQGRGHEPQTIFTAYKRGSHGRFARPFMAKVSSETDEGGYILSKYIEDNHAQKKQLSDLMRQREYTLNLDAGKDHNTINGISIEAGGTIGNEKYLANPIERNTWRKLATKLDSESRIMENLSGDLFIKINELRDYLILLQEGGVDLCSADLGFLLKNLSAEEQVQANKMIRILRKTRKLKEELIQNGSYPKYKKMLSKDLQDSFPYRGNKSCVLDKEEFDTMIKYPKLIANELGVNNLPDSVNDLFHLYHYGLIDLDLLKKCVSRDSMKQYLIDVKKLNTDLIEDKELIKEYHLEKDIEIAKLRQKIKKYERQLDDEDNDENENIDKLIQISLCKEELKKLQKNI